MKAIRNEEEAVSPVIGVILMVAIVVILAAVIAAFVFGMAGTTTTTKNVAVTVAHGETASGTPVDTYVITIQGGADLAKVTLMQYSVDGATKAAVTDETGTAIASPGAGYLAVGDLVTTGDQSALTTLSGHRLILTASFDDGSEQVIFDKVM